VIPIISLFLVITVIVVDLPYSHKIRTIIQFYSYCYSNPWCEWPFKNKCAWI